MDPAVDDPVVDPVVDQKQPVEDVGALKRALEHVKRERAAAKDALKKYEGFDPDEFAKLKQEREEREQQTATKKGEFENWRKKILDDQQAQTDKWGHREKSLLNAIERSLLDAEATRAIAAAKGKPKLLLPHVKSQTRVLEEDGEFVVRVVAKDGTPRYGKDGELMQMAELISEMRDSDDFSAAFEGSGTTGSGAAQKNAAGGGKNSKTRAEFEKLDQLERVSFFRSGGTLTD